MPPSPRTTASCATYVTNPTLPALLEIVLASAGIAPTNFPCARPGHDLPDVHRGREPTGQRGGLGNASLKPRYPRVRYANQNRLGLLGGLLANDGDLSGRLPERTPTERRRRPSHLVGRRDGGALRGQRATPHTYKFGGGLQAIGRTPRHGRCSGCTMVSIRGRAEGQGGGPVAASVSRYIGHAAARRRSETGAHHRKKSWIAVLSPQRCPACAGGNDDQRCATPRRPAPPVDAGSATPVRVRRWRVCWRYSRRLVLHRRTPWSRST